MQRGFTLIELIVVVVLLGVVGLGITSFIQFGATIFVDTTKRDEVLSSSRFVIERLNRELREALPNSARVRGNGAIQCLEFVPVRASVYYDQIPQNNQTSNQINALPASNYSFANGDYAVVYPSVSNGQLDVYQDSANKRFALAGVTDNGAGALATYQLTNAVSFAQSSPARRLFIVRQPVSYCVIAGKLYRYSNYNYAQTQPLTGMGSGVLMADNLTNNLASAADLPFTVQGATLTRNAYVNLLLRFSVNEGDVLFNNEVHIVNAP